MRRTSFTLIAIMGLAACGNTKSKPEGQKAQGKTASKAFTLKRVDNLKVDLPPSANLSDGIGGGVMIMAPDLVVTIARAGASTPKTIAEAKTQVQMFKPQKLHAEALKDGYALTFENKGGLGRNYFVRVRRVIGGKAYTCTTTASRPAQQVNALKVCKSLRN